MGDCGHQPERLLIVFNELLDEALLDTICRKFPGSEVKFHHSAKGTTVPKELYQSATILVTLYDVPNLESGKHLKLIHSVSSGLDHLLAYPIVEETDIPLTNSSGIHGPPMAEWTIMNWLVASRNYPKMHDDQKNHKWSDRRPYMTGIHDQVGKRVGILGYGSVGRQIACMCKSMGMIIHAYTASPRYTPESRRDSGYRVPRTGDPEGTIPESWHHGLDKESIHSFLSLGLDHLVISLPLTEQTTHIIGTEELKLLSNKCSHPFTEPYLTNLSRGQVVDQGALLAALEVGQIAFAALDVTDPEPLPPDHYLWDAPNKQISPHVSCMGREYLPRSLDIVKENLERMAAGDKLVNAYDRGKGY